MPRWAIGAIIGCGVFAVISACVIGLVPDVLASLNLFTLDAHPYDRCQLVLSLTYGEQGLLALSLVISLPGRLVVDRIQPIIGHGREYWTIVMLASALPFTLLGATIASKRVSRVLALAISVASVILLVPTVFFFYFALSFTCTVY